MRIGALKETSAGERRVALVPESCKKLVQAGYDVAIESGAGDAAGFSDAAYAEVGATTQPDAAALTGGSDLLLKVTAPTIDGDLSADLSAEAQGAKADARQREGGRDEVAWMRPGAIYLGSL